jgi:hypothetical protein
MPVAKVAVQDVESYDIRVKSNKVYAGHMVVGQNPGARMVT